MVEGYDVFGFLENAGISFEPASEYKKNRTLLRDKTYAFALRCVKLCQYLQKDPIFTQGQNPLPNPAVGRGEFLLSKQMLRSGTSIGALLREAEFAQSLPDYISKFSIALKEANETEYWLLLLKDSGYLEERLYESLCNDAQEIIRLLISSIKTLKARL